MANNKKSIGCCQRGVRTSGRAIFLPQIEKRCPPVNQCCPNNQDNSNTNTSNPTNTNTNTSNPNNTNTFNPTNNPTFNPTINVNPVINIPLTPENGGNGEQGLLTEFQVDQPRTMIAESIPIPIIEVNDPVTNSRQIAIIRVIVDNISNRVWMTGTVCWQALSEEASNVSLLITRTRPGGMEELIFETVDQADEEVPVITSNFTFVDETPILTQGPQLVEYRFRIGNSNDDSEAIIVGPIIFTGAEIRANNP